MHIYIYTYTHHFIVFPSEVHLALKTFYGRSLARCAICRQPGKLFSVVCVFYQDREFTEMDMQSGRGAPNKITSTPPLTPVPSIQSLDQRRTGCCARRPNSKKYQVGRWQHRSASSSVRCSGLHALVFVWFCVFRSVNPSC